MTTEHRMSSFAKWELPTDHLICMYSVEASAGSSVQKAANDIASYSSEGLQSAGKRKERFTAEVLSCQEQADGKGVVLVGYPPESFDLESNGISSILSVIAGWNTSVSSLANVRVNDIFLPRSVTSKFQGSLMGQMKINELLGVRSRSCYLHVPVYPRLGLSLEDYKEVLATLLKGAPESSPDIIADSELIFNPQDCPVSGRVEVAKEFNTTLIQKMRALKDKTQSLGGKTLFFMNVTALPSKAIESATLVKEAGLDGIIVNALTSGLSLLEELRRQFSSLIIYAHANMHALLTRGVHTGVSFEVLVKLFKLAGADIIYTGAPYGSLDLIGGVERHVRTVQNYNDIVRSKIHNLEPAIPCIGGGITLGNLEANLKLSGLPLEMVVGSGVYDSPSSPSEAIRLFKKAIDITTEMKKTMWSDGELSDYMKQHREYFLKHFLDPTSPLNEELGKAFERYSKLRLD